MHTQFTVFHSTFSAQKPQACRYDLTIVRDPLLGLIEFYLD